MIRFVAKRVALGLLTLLGVSLLVFLGTEVLPGDVASAILGQAATPETVAALRAKLGLEDPAIWRYFDWLWSLLGGDLGTSLANGRSIAMEVAPRLSNTLVLAGYAALLAVPLALALGVATAMRAGSLFDRVTNVVALVAISLPEFFIGYLLILVFAVRLGWLPSFAMVNSSMSLGEKLYFCTLPAVTLMLAVVAHMLRMTRASLLVALSQPYIETARLKGLTARRIVLRHALPNVLGPIASIVAFYLAWLVVGVIVVEAVFVYPGLGQLMVDGTAKRDLPVVQACAMIFACAFIGLNVLADVVGTLANPRIRHPR
jgi:peptide/nickel transport system permease protein